MKTQIETTDPFIARIDELLALEKSQDLISLLEPIVEERADASFYNFLALAYKKNFQDDDALATWRKCLELDPKHFNGLTNLGTALMDLKMDEEAVPVLQEAVRLYPDHFMSLHHLANALTHVKRPHEALPIFEKALTLDPNHFASLVNAGVTFYQIQEPEKGMRLFELALHSQKHIAIVYYNMAMAAFMMGDYAHAWEWWEWRYHSDPIKTMPFTTSLPEWRGEQTVDCNIIVHGEQGHGDAIQFLRFLPRLANEFKSILTIQPDSLLRLFQYSMPNIEFVGMDGKEHDDLQCWTGMFSIPRWHGITADTIPNSPYLKVPDEEVTKWAKRMKDIKGPKIGLTWAGSAAHQADAYRSIDPALFAPFANVDATFISLQKTRNLIPPPIPNFVEFTDELEDFYDTAALIKNLDLVISVDTAVVHVAGGLGCPCWVLLPFANDWRWGKQTDTTPWYPSLRLFRQTDFDQWKPVIKRVVEELRNL